jgi:hypothetical protein
MHPSHKSHKALDRIDKFFPMKPGSIGKLDIYLGAKVSKVQLPNQVEAWALSPSKYVQEAINNVEEYLDQECNGRKLSK